MPKIAYVCEPCWQDASDCSCYGDRSEVRVLSDGLQLCEACYEDGNYLNHDSDDESRPKWSELPMPPVYGPVPA